MTKFMHKLKTMAFAVSSGVLVFSGYSIFRREEKFYENFLMPIVHQFPPELAHNVGVQACKYNFFQKDVNLDSERLKCNILNISFSNPIGIAAGFDKQGEAVQGLNDIGFGFIEVGSITPLPQPGNATPRVFRLPEDKAIINRYGFNSDGHDIVLERLNHLRPGFSGVLGVNLGKNKTSESPVEDYTSGIIKFGPVADYLVVNVSSPNTPGLRNLQHKKDLEELLAAVIKARDVLAQKPPIFLKLAPDLTQQEKQDIADVINRKNCKIEGLIISNTTTNKSNLKNTVASGEIGGLSGRPLTEPSTKMIAEMYKLTKGRLPIIGVGGVFTGEDAYRKIAAGASLVQIYTAFIYHGPPVVSRIKKELDEILAQKGYNNVAEAIGKECDIILKEK